MRYDFIQILRGVAAICVVFYHTNIYLAALGKNETSFFKVFDVKFSYGALLFFVISGFLMAHLIVKGYEKFFLRRILRIYPTYIIAVVSVVMLKLILFSSITQYEFLKSLTLLPFGEIQYTLDIEWTLIYEVSFYIVCTLFTFRKMKNLYLPFLIVWFLVIVASTYIFKVPTSFLPEPSKILFSIYNLYFILGGLAYYLHKKINLNTKINCLIIGLIILCIPIYEKLSDYLNLTSQTHITFMSVLFFIIILFGSRIQLRTTTKLLKVAVSLGDYSYGIYLIHVSIITIGFAVLYSLTNMPINAFIASLLLIITLVIGWFFGKLDIKIYNFVKDSIGNKKAEI